MDINAIISKAQKGLEGTAPWMVGEQLKEICCGDMHCAELVEADLKIEAMSLAACEKKIKAFADSKHKHGSNCVCVLPTEAEKIIREFYGLPLTKESQDTEQPAIIELSDFL